MATTGHHASTDVSRLPMPAGIVLLLSMVAAATLAYLPFMLTPDPVPADAPAQRFSAERALAGLHAVASEPRPMGSPAHDAAIRTIRTELQTMGVESAVVEEVVARADFGQVNAARVRNVIARIPGTESTGAVLLMSHFNSVPTSPSANDGGLGVVTTLETVRAIRAGQPLRNDLILWFGDADETTAMNAYSLARHPWFADVELALAFEGIGMRGPSLLSFAGAGNPTTTLPVQPVGGNAGVENVGSSFTTQNGWWLREALRVLPHPVPALAFNDVGLGVSPDLGMAIAGTDVAGLSFAQIGDTAAYHTDLDRPDLTSAGSLQSSGEAALALVRHFGTADFGTPRSESSIVAFTVVPGWVAAYPTAWGLPLAVTALALLIGGLAVGRHRHAVALTGLVIGVLLCALSMTLAAVTAAAATLLLQPDAHFARSPYGGQTWRLLVVCLLALACTSAVHLAAARLLKHPPRVVGTAAGSLFVLAALAVLTAIALPALGYVFVWPALAGSAALVWWMLWPSQMRRPWLLTAVLALLGAVVVIVTVPLVHLLAGAAVLTVPAYPAIIAAVVALLAGALAPHFHAFAGPRRWTVPVTLVAALTAVAALGVPASSFSKQRPRPNHIQYAFDADTGQARWVSAATAPDAWTRQFFETGYHSERMAFSPGYYFGQDFDVITASAPAPASGLTAPEVTVVDERIEAGVRTVTVRVASGRGAPAAHLDLALPGDLVATSVEGRDLPVAPTGSVRRLPVAAYNIGPEGVHVTLSVRSSQPITGTLTDYTNGLPDLPGTTVRPRPADFMPAFFDFRDPTSVHTRVRF